MEPNESVQQDENGETLPSTGTMLRSPQLQTAEEEQLPIELASFTDRFVDSLSAKVHSTPPSIDRLSGRFQDFYVKASTHIATHISALTTRHQRERNSAVAATNRASRTARSASSASSNEGSRPAPARTLSEQQLLTPSEIAERKKARKQLEAKSIALEEAVERRACERIYDRIWRHRATDDAERDEKLRSRTAALAVVGIGLKDLGIDLKDDSNESKQEEIRDELESARRSLARMTDERSPLAKLKHLEIAHKKIVETLSRFRSSSSSADEILPTLIFSLITGPSEGINVISNVCFIQRFRSTEKIDGEAAYCLTNLEAAITFLETVDLASLRESETPTRSSRPSSGASTPIHAKENIIPLDSESKARPVAPTLDATNVQSAQVSSRSIEGTPARRPKGPIATYSHQRRLSTLLQPPSQALGAASDAVLNTADQGIKTIGNSLENSYRFLFGRLKERQVSGVGANGKGEVIVPKTLEEAQKLVSTHPTEDDAASVKSSASRETTEATKDESASQDQGLQVLKALPSSRDRSVDSNKSGENEPRGFTNSSGDSPVSTANAAVESMKSFGNSINPLNRLSSINMIRPFGRRESPSAADRRAAVLGKGTDGSLGEVADLTATFPDLADSLQAKQISKIDPPIKRFMEVENPGDLKINEVLQLLRDYRRIAKALEKLDAFS